VAAELFRKKGCPVIIIQDREAAEGPGSKGFENIESLKISETDLNVYKDYSNAFWKTDLEDLLKTQNIEFLVLSGFAAEYCVLFTLNGAEERGFGASLLQHGVAGTTIEAVRQIHQIRPTISLEAIDFILKGDSN
jgi:nicotinamidase-related amidase